ncbi:hypothetical protein D088_710049 [Salmonella enterica subsp. houtenae serovar 16:z4,z32:-- str. RKS3027]|nr:hypothetical protein D088_710049 [Salmonella enterica subsp. houtenae serovar 16:z4,z32:-- str. RKS3027]
MAVGSGWKSVSNTWQRRWGAESTDGGAIVGIICQVSR